MVVGIVVRFTSWVLIVGLRLCSYVVVVLLIPLLRTWCEQMRITLMLLCSTVCVKISLTKRGALSVVMTRRLVLCLVACGIDVAWTTWLRFRQPDSIAPVMVVSFLLLCVVGRMPMASALA